MASKHAGSRWQDTILARQLKPAGCGLVLEKSGGIRFATPIPLLRSQGVDVTVQQELLRHADI